MSRDIRVVPLCADRLRAAIFQHFGNDGNGATARWNPPQHRRFRSHCAAASAVSARCNSSQSLPASLLVRPPIGDIEALRLALAPALARGLDRVGILSVNDEAAAPVGLRVRWDR